jgi:hypothetical protein
MCGAPSHVRQTLDRPRDATPRRRSRHHGPVAFGSDPAVERAQEAIERARRDLEETGVPAYTAVAFPADGPPVVSPFVVAVPGSARDHARTLGSSHPGAQVFIVGRQFSRGRVALTVWAEGREDPVHHRFEVLPSESS